MPEVSITLIVTKVAAEQLKEMRLEKPKVAALVFKNFIRPLELKYEAKNLEGKYKPSWMIPHHNTRATAHSMAVNYKVKSCYHYHFGFPFWLFGVLPLSACAFGTVVNLLANF